MTNVTLRFSNIKYYCGQSRRTTQLCEKMTNLFLIITKEHHKVEMISCFFFFKHASLLDYNLFEINPDSNLITLRTVR